MDTQGSSNGPTYDPTSRDRLSSFSIHFTNICGLNSNFYSVETHLATSLPNPFLLSETQLSKWSFLDPFQISHYNLYSHFILKVVSVLTITQTHLLHSSWILKILTLTFSSLRCISLQLLLCFAFAIALLILLTCSLSLNILLPEPLLASCPNAEVLYIRDFNVHHTDWLQSTHTDDEEIEALYFPISSKLE